jgi:hypothetical protein
MVGDDPHDRGRAIGVAEVDAEAGTGRVLARNRAPGPPAGDAVGAGDDVVDLLGRRVDAKAVQDVGHARAPWVDRLVRADLQQ